MDNSRANKAYSHKEQMLLGKFWNMYMDNWTVTVHNPKAFAKACVKAFDEIRDNPTYEEFERIMRSYPHTNAATT